MASLCKGCGKAIEWHITSGGKNMPIDPEPHSDGNLVFDGRLRLMYARVGSKPRMYRSHFSTCPKAGEFRKPRPVACDREDCERTDNHRHCYRCGGTDHLADECPED